MSPRDLGAASNGKRGVVPSLTVAPPITLADMGATRLASLCQGLGFDPSQTLAATDVFRKMAVAWGSSPLAHGPRWTSDITDDHTPFEFSLAICNNAPELRFLIEAQGELPSIRTNWEASRALNERLARDIGADLRRLGAVEDLFVPNGDTCRFAMWHAVVLRPSGPPDIKVYLNPQVRGKRHARALVETAMQRLGFDGATAHLPETGPDDDICYFSLDLSPRPDARVKVYTAHHRATLARIKAAVACARGFESRRVREFCETMGNGPGPYTARPVLTCLSFVQSQLAPTAATVHFPVRTYALDDAAVRDRVRGYLEPEAASVYTRALDAFADRRLEDGVGMQTYVSLRLEREQKRLTVYLAPEAFEIAQVAVSQPKVSGVVMRSAAADSWLSAVGEEK